MSNALKLKKKAAEFEQKKQFDKALQIYIQILDESTGEDDEADVALYNRVGDLLMRQGSVGDAVNYYEKAVDLYAESGFFNNAIALCNKILRQSPGRNSIYYKLGKISAKKGFISDAKQNFLEYADRMQKGGQLDEAFRALKEFADLCPDQDDIRLMLAEQLSKKDRKGEAIEQLQHLYEKFVAEGRGAEARATVDRMKAIDPEVEPKEGGATARAKSSDLVFIDLSDSSKREEAAKPKAPRPEQSRKTVKLPQPEPEPEPELDVLGDLPPLEPQAEAEAEPEDDLLPLPPLEEAELDPLDPLDPLEPLEPLDLGGQAEGLETMEEFSAPDQAEPAQVAGFEQTVMDPELDAAFPAETLPELEPLTGSEFAELDLGPPADPTPRHSTHDLALPGRLPSLDGPGGRSPLSLTGEMELIIPESDLPLPKHRKKSANGAPPPLQVDFTPEVDTSDLDGRSASASSKLSLTSGADSLAEPQEVEAEPEADDVELPAWMSPGEDAPPSDEAPDLPLLDVGPDPVIPEPHHHSHTPLAREVDALRQRAAAEPTNWVVRQRLAEALLEDGDREEGLQELEVVMLGLERSHDLDAARSVADEIIRLNPNSVRHHQKRVEYAFRAADKPRLADAYLELADSLFRAGHADKARAVYQRVLELAPDDPRAQAALSTFEPPPRQQPTPSAVRTVRREAAPENDDFVNLSDWLTEDQAPKSTRMVVDEEAPSGDEEADFADMLRKFKQGVSDNVDEEDHESHYDLGVAYKEMGLVDEAISEFQKALRAPHGRVRTYEALGQCFLEKQQFQVAATILGRALNEPGIGDDQLVGVLYLLGYCSEALRSHADALTFYQRVFAVDIQFRDVADRLARLEKVGR